MGLSGESGWKGLSTAAEAAEVGVLYWPALGDSGGLLSVLPGMPRMKRGLGTWPYQLSTLLPTCWALLWLSWLERTWPAGWCWCCCCLGGLPGNLACTPGD